MSNLQQRIVTGAVLGVVATAWIAAGNVTFAAGFVVVSYVLQSEYSSMVRSVGIVPATRTSICVGSMCFVVAALYPAIHELIFPLCFTLTMMVLILTSRESTNIGEFSTTVLGVAYTGYLPSYWVRLHAIKDANTSGAAIVWCTWLSIVFSDVGAYFVGKNFGSTKLSAVAPAAGHASPNKTIEGALGGCLGSALVAILSAYLLKWPYWPVSGAVYGLTLGVLGLLGDLTESVLKRDAGMKDSGDILPGHGGLLDRFDSYILSAPVAFLFVKYLLPYLADQQLQLQK